MPHPNQKMRKQTSLRKILFPMQNTKADKNEHKIKKAETHCENMGKIPQDCAQ